MEIGYKFYITILVVALITAGIRVVPFLIFKEGRIPQWIVYLGDTLPQAIMIILVIFCVREITLTRFPYGGPELIALGATVLLHLRFRNLFISMISGTGLYMLLINYLG